MLLMFSFCDRMPRDDESKKKKKKNQKKDPKSLSESRVALI